MNFAASDLKQGSAAQSQRGGDCMHHGPQHGFTGDSQASRRDAFRHQTTPFSAVRLTTWIESELTKPFDLKGSCPTMPRLFLALSDYFLHEGDDCARCDPALQTQRRLGLRVRVGRPDSEGEVEDNVTR